LNFTIYSLKRFLLLCQQLFCFKHISPTLVYRCKSALFRRVRLHFADCLRFIRERARGRLAAKAH
jgi:hypothetical protein